ncbi:MAG: CinA family nicotinamide mononucleotide deamidase-related protein [Anaerolineae bacterium]|nr:CinA family nicotinamide mononucleotide deamidase-related protein [Anaerolineae bacterium]
MPVAEIIAIGTELLLGEIQDTNTSYLARQLRQIGVDIYRATLVGDNEYRISELIKEAGQRADIILTTGGLGPTVDDPTRQAVALAVGSPLEFRPELWEQIVDRFTRFNRQPTENNRKQAFIPAGALAIENPVGTAPAFLVDVGQYVVISLPGVPREMEAIFEVSILPYLKKRFELKGLIKIRVLHLAGVGESIVDELIGDTERYTNPTVGLLAKSGQIDVRIAAKADSLDEADRRILEVETLLRERLGDHIFGADEETLESVILETLKRKNWKLVVVECSQDDILASRLKTAGFLEERILIQTSTCTPEQLKETIASLQNTSKSEVILGFNVEIGKERHKLHVSLVMPDGLKEITRYYGGPPAMATAWASVTALDCLRRNLQVNNALGSQKS